MKCVLKTEPKLSEVRVRMESNSYTDSMPMVREFIIRKQAPKVNSQAFGLACAVLLADYCGDFLEIPHLTIACDYVEAMRVICNRQINVAPFNGEARTLATHELEIVCHRAGQASAGADQVRPLASDVPILRIDWFSDFVDADSRQSTDSRLGMYFTNSALAVEEEFVSLAIALIHGGDGLGRIAVPLSHSTLTAKHLRMAEALNVVAITLDWLVAEQKAGVSSAGSPRISARQRRPKA